jgi:hypothetical protein
MNKMPNRQSQTDFKLRHYQQFNLFVNVDAVHRSLPMPVLSYHWVVCQISFRSSSIVH